MSKEVEPNNIEPVDMFAVRKYTFNGIEVLVQIDRLEKTVSLVEWDSYKKEYVEKKYVFCGRTIGYAKTWLKIMAAMSSAVQEGIKELEKIEAAELERTARLVEAASSALPKRDWK